MKIVKNSIRIIGLTIAIFIVATLITMRLEVASDGNNTYGFPFTFLQQLGGKRFPAPESRNEMHIGYLLIDLVISGLVAFGVLSFFKRNKS